MRYLKSAISKFVILVVSGGIHHQGFLQNTGNALLYGQPSALMTRPQTAQMMSIGV